MTKTYSDDQILSIRKMANKGVADGVIAKKLGLTMGVVAIISTRFWKEKMKNKKHEPEVTIS